VIIHNITENIIILSNYVHGNVMSSFSVQ